MCGCSIDVWMEHVLLFVKREVKREVITVLFFLNDSIRIALESVKLKNNTVKRLTFPPKKKGKLF